MIDVIAFDLFGTVFDLSGVPREEIVAYIDHIEKPEWSPLELPKSWQRLPAYPDAAEGLERLRTKFKVVTCSNAPLTFTWFLLQNTPLPFDAVIPIQANRVYKPDSMAYLTVCQVMLTMPHKVLMVTGNPRLGRRDFGDYEASRALGFEAALIRGESKLKTIVELAESLGC